LQTSTAKQPRTFSIAAAGTRETEATAVAAQIVATGRPNAAPLRATTPEVSTGDAMPAPASVDRVLATGGQPLEPQLRTRLEHLFGHEFARVRIHTDEAAAQSAHAIGAKAYTAGEHIVFGSGRFAPETIEGRRLLAHELTHVIRQPTGSNRIERDLEDWRRVQSELEAFRQVAEEHYDGPEPRRLKPAERAAAQLVFHDALNVDNVIVSEGGALTLGGYARTLPDRIHFPSGSYARSDFLPYLIHELTHVWQYQRGAEIPGMAWEAVVGIYDYGGDDGLREAWEAGKAFDEFTTEQQGDILEHYYERLMLKADVSPFQPFVDDVRSGNEKKHRYKTVKPLPAGTLDVAKLNEEYRLRTEAEIIRLLAIPMAPGDSRAPARAHTIVELFRKLFYWAPRYEERFDARRADDRLITLLFARVSAATRERIFGVLGLRAPRSAQP
jgi:hypothetical protein